MARIDEHKGVNARGPQYPEPCQIGGVSVSYPVLEDARSKRESARDASISTQHHCREMYHRTDPHHWIHATAIATSSPHTQSPPLS